MTRTAGLHALADTLNTVQVGQLIVGEQSQGDGCVEAAGHAAALARLVFEGDLHPVHGHGGGCAAPAEMRVQLTHRLLYQLVSVPVHLQGQVPGLQVPQLLHLPTELGFLHLEATELCEDLGEKLKEINYFKPRCHPLTSFQRWQERTQLLLDMHLMLEKVFEIRL